MPRMFTDNIDMVTPYTDNLKAKPEKFGGKTNAEEDLETDFANVLLNVFPDVCNDECFGMDTKSMCLYIANKTHFIFLDVIYYKRVEVDQMSFIFGKKLSSVVDKSPESRLSVLKELMCVNYDFGVVFCVT